MCSWDDISHMIEYAAIEYPTVDIRTSKKQFRKREYEKLIVGDLIEKCCNRMFNDPIEILEDYESCYEYLKKSFNSDVYRIQLNTIRKLLSSLRERRIMTG